MQQRFFENSALEKNIQEYFYNSLVNYVIDKNIPITKSNSEQVIREGIINLITTILRNSGNTNGIVVPSNPHNLIINSYNCPIVYKQMFDKLLELKTRIPTTQELNFVALGVMQLESFIKIDPTKFLLEAAGQVKVDISRLHDSDNITSDMIRDAFYNEMVAQMLQAINDKLLTREMLIDQDPVIYLALPAITIIAAIEQSPDIEGIRLLNQCIITKYNCPQVDNFANFTSAMLAIKNDILSLPREQKQFMRYKLFDKEIPQELAHLQTPALMKTIGNLNAISIEIGRQTVFKTMIQQTIAFSLECAVEIKTPLHKMVCTVS